MKLIKNFILWIIFLVVSLLYIPGLIYIYWSILNYLFFSKVGNGSGFSNTIDWVLHTNFFLVLGVVIVSIFIYCVASYILINLVAVRKDLWCKVGNAYDDLKGQPHKTRQSGKEWKAEYKSRKEKEKIKKKQEEAKKKQKAYQEQEEEFQRYGFYDKYNEWQKHKQNEEQQQYYQQSNNQQYYQQNTNQEYYKQNNTQQTKEMSELEEARIAFMLKSMDFTEEELKHNRNVLIKAWHTDNGEQNAENAQKINRYYSLLKQYAKK